MPTEMPTLRESTLGDMGMHKRLGLVRRRGDGAEELQTCGGGC